MSQGLGRYLRPQPHWRWSSPPSSYPPFQCSSSSRPGQRDLRRLSVSSFQVEGQSEGGERRKKSTSASSSLALANFRVVLVAPKTPGNIGSVCRLCDCFETSHLTLVTPRCSLDSSEVKWLAVDKTKSPNFSLSRIRVVSSLKEALAETKASIAFTRRTGSLRMPHKSVATMLEVKPPPYFFLKSNPIKY